MNRVKSRIHHPADLEAVILCGGRGTRLGLLTSRTPKPLLPVGGVPFVLHLLLRLKQEGIQRFLLAAHYLAENFDPFIRRYGAQLGQVRRIVEPEPLGTGGAIRYAAQTVRSSPFLVLNGDSWVGQPIAPVLEEHFKEGRDFTGVAVRADRVEGRPKGKGVWRVGAEGRVLGLVTEDAPSLGWVNAGIYLLNRDRVLSWPAGPYSFEKNEGSLLRGWKAGLFRSEERLVDIGTPECYRAAERWLESEFASNVGKGRVE